MPRHVSSALVLGSLVVSFATVGCGEPKPSLTEALAAKPEDTVLKDYKAAPKPRPDDLPPPTTEEFKAWNRKDVGGEKFLYKWDKANVSRMLVYWEELQCFRDKMKAEGEKAFGAEPGSAQEEEWYQFKRFFVNHVNGWQQRLFAKEPRILEKSKYIGNFLEAHELVMNGYPGAYNSNDRTQIEKQDAHWMIVEAKNKKYSESLGAKWPDWDAGAKATSAHQKVCELAMKPPDRDKKKRGRGKGPI